MTYKTPWYVLLLTVLCHPVEFCKVAWSAYRTYRIALARAKVLPDLNDGIRSCEGCGAFYHKSWNGPGEQKLCPDCSGAT